ncbi:MAG: hypothetical protein IJ637_05670, partial [Prevotella sp.]|nr:hypothetical protein [Prevotella sp.]
MKNKTRYILATIADLAVAAAVVLLNPLGPLQPAPPPAIPDKVEVHYYQQPSPAVMQREYDNAARKLEEMQYYLHVHNVTDDGYNMVADYNTRLQQCSQQLESRLARLEGDADTVSRQIISTIRIPAQERPMIAVKTMGGFWRAGYFHSHFSLSGKAIARDPMNRIVCGIWQADSIVTGVRKDSLGVYRGQMNSSLLAHGQGSYDSVSGSHYEGFWQDDACHGFGFESATDHQVRIGTWKF